MAQITVRQANALIGKPGEWHLTLKNRKEDVSVVVDVIILDARNVYNRIDLLVSPVQGMGQVWVQAENVIV